MCLKAQGDIILRKLWKNIFHKKYEVNAVPMLYFKKKLVSYLSKAYLATTDQGAVLYV